MAFAPTEPAEKKSLDRRAPAPEAKNCLAGVFLRVLEPHCISLRLCPRKKHPWKPPRLRAGFRVPLSKLCQNLPELQRPNEKLSVPSNREPISEATRRASAFRQNCL
ncbi:hypothetical protein NDU88_006367 [Pleurodeles waltl]|uniref:Uncharacterized protein n=1 Tax=Pleurodeles waltl TaxID=8319 RepID=A0AAV7NTX2_PLEWA|nr:hypothetical protein NDU88_006367 [Pleurodeles waltl]